MIPAAIAAPIVGWTVLGTVLVAGAGGFYAGKRWELSNTLSAKARVVELENAIETAGMSAKNKAERSTERFDELTLQLKTQTEQEKVYRDEVQRKLDTIASRTRVCLTPPVVRVLRPAGEGGRDADGGDPRKPVGPSPAVPTAGDGPGRGVSEFAISQYLSKVENQYVDLAARHSGLAKEVRRLPCVRVDETR